MVKDRLESFMKKRHQSFSKTSFKMNQREMTWKSLSLMSLLDMAKQIRVNIDRLKEHVDRIKYLQCELLSSPFTDNRTQDEYQQHKQEVRLLAAAIRQQLQHLDTPQLVENIQYSPAQKRMRNNQQNALRKEFKSVIDELISSENTYKDKVRKRVRRQLSIIGRPSSEEDIEDMIDTNTSPFTQNIITDSQVSVNDQRDHLDIRIREKKEIESIENKVTEVNHMFQDVHHLVQAQGNTLDRIETHVLRTESYVEDAKGELKSTKKNKKKTKRRNFFLAIGSVVVAVVVGLIAILVVIV